MINNADSFSQPSLIIFTKGADIFGHDSILRAMVLTHRQKSFFKLPLELWELTNFIFLFYLFFPLSFTQRGHQWRLPFI